MHCRPNCGACCTAPSINSPIPGMPNGKPAAVRCVQLDLENRCKFFGSPERPSFCASFNANLEMFGESREYAINWLTHLETLTKPDF